MLVNDRFYLPLTFPGKRESRKCLLSRHYENGPPECCSQLSDIVMNTPRVIPLVPSPFLCLSFRTVNFTVSLHRDSFHSNDVVIFCDSVIQLNQADCVSRAPYHYIIIVLLLYCTKWCEILKCYDEYDGKFYKGIPHFC